jgi:hypothetical protein
MMKKVLAILPFLILASCDRATTSVHGIMGQSEETVYVCTGPSSRCYHSKRRCKGLENCSGTIRAVSIDEAIKWGRRPCKFCH